MTAGHHQHMPQQPDRGLRRRLLTVFILTAVIALAQAVGSAVTGSLALLTDTAHAISDASGLLVAVLAATMMLRPANSRRTWGFARIEVIAALGQAALLLVVGGYAAIDGVRRLFDPHDVPGAELLWFGLIGLAANIAAIAILASNRGANFNLRAAFLEVLNDALGSLGVIIAAIVISTTGFHQADSIAALLIAALIVPRAYFLLRETIGVLMEFTPKGVDLEEVREHILGLEHVRDVHDLHASMIGTGMPVISGHVVVDDRCFESSHAPQILEAIRGCVKDHFPVSFDHATFQLETAALHEQESNPAHHS
ncbi:cation diffusion facilitator family transporter [Citricoccus sp. GCM10030269]|uniref:cation diffusion facilitator family transporter n=1 Tax=Citricoccus sp. GCM10030269 TaxID=3273388 RepID=UPI00361B3555